MKFIPSMGVLQITMQMGVDAAILVFGNLDWCYFRHGVVLELANPIRYDYACLNCNIDSRESGFD